MQCVGGRGVKLAQRGIGQVPGPVTDGHGRRHREGGGDAGDVSPRFEIPGGMSPQKSRFLKKFLEFLLKILDFPIFLK